MSTNTYTILKSEQFQDAVEVIFWHGRSDYKAHIRIAKMDGVDGGVSFHDLTQTRSGAEGVAFIPASIIVEAMELLGCDVPEDSYFRACHKASGKPGNMCRDLGNMCENCPQRDRTNKMPATLFAAHRRIEQLEQSYDLLYEARMDDKLIGDLEKQVEGFNPDEVDTAEKPKEFTEDDEESVFTIREAKECCGQCAPKAVIEGDTITLPLLGSTRNILRDISTLGEFYDAVEKVRVVLATAMNGVDELHKLAESTEFSNTDLGIKKRLEKLLRDLFNTLEASVQEGIMVVDNLDDIFQMLYAEFGCYTLQDKAMLDSV